MRESLEIDEHRRFQERFWVVERWAWFVFAILLLAALAGLSGGGGYLSQAQADIPGGQVTYPRIARWVVNETLTIRFGRAPSNAERELFLPQTFLDVFELETTQPEPIRSSAKSDGNHYYFDAAEEGAVVRVGIRALKPGFVRYGLGLDGGPPADLVTIVLP